MQHHKKEWERYYLRRITGISQDYYYRYIKQRKRVAQLNKEWRL